MKFQKKPEYDYVNNGVSEEQGYTKWYDASKGLLFRFIVGMLLSIIMVACIFNDKESYKMPRDIWEALIFFGGGFLLLNLTAFLSRLSQLAVLSKGKLGDDCLMERSLEHIVYIGEVSRKTRIISLVVFDIVIIGIFSILTVVCNGVFKTLFLWALWYLIVYLAIADAYVLCKLLRSVKKDDVIFGEYKKSNFIESSKDGT